MPQLEVIDRIIIPTKNGERVIQLYVGDITGLQVKDRVDVILVSAFLCRCLLSIYFIDSLDQKH